MLAPEIEEIFDEPIRTAKTVNVGPFLVVINNGLVTVIGFPCFLR